MHILWLKYRKPFKRQIDGFNETADTEGWGEKGHKKILRSQNFPLDT